MMGWQWHQLDHMQIIYTLLQTDNHASTSPVSFYRPEILLIIIIKKLKMLLKNKQEQHIFNGPLSGTTQVSQYLKGKTNLDFTEARDSEWQWH